MSKVHGIRDSPAYKYKVLFVPATDYRTSRGKEVTKRTLQTLSHEELVDIATETLVWIQLLEVDMSHMNVRNYGLDWRTDKDTKQMKTLEMVVHDVLGYTNPNDVFREHKKRWDEILNLQRQIRGRMKDE